MKADRVFRQNDLMPEQHAQHPDRQHPDQQAVPIQQRPFAQQLAQVASDSDRLWLAFQYITDELSDNDTEAFEMAMLEAPELCEAVAQATSLLATVNLSCEEWHRQKSAPTVGTAASTAAADRQFASGKDFQVISGKTDSDTRSTVTRPVRRTWRSALAMGLPVAASVGVLFVLSQTAWLQDSATSGSSNTSQASVSVVPVQTAPDDNVKAAEWLLSVYALGDGESDTDEMGYERFDEHDMRLPATSQATHEDLLADSGWLPGSRDPLLTEKRSAETHDSSTGPSLPKEESYQGDDVVVPEWLLAAILLDQPAVGVDPDSHLEFHDENSDIF